MAPARAAVASVAAVRGVRVAGCPSPGRAVEEAGPGRGPRGRWERTTGRGAAAPWTTSCRGSSVPHPAGPRAARAGRGRRGGRRVRRGRTRRARARRTGRIRAMPSPECRSSSLLHGARPRSRRRVGSHRAMGASGADRAR
ncbi:hypothetical protein SLI_3360 [Streptomyces lividans 1326]|uniref:Uncharacterized protein n=1 Tax=Streptomyces lividans 1326 TaxID=1200984 RepID=A0A7U9HAZ9_STRLI|nr:hypothetical protein SLI_3360 [Streptomyces lividans 1326]